VEVVDLEEVNQSPTISASVMVGSGQGHGGDGARRSAALRIDITVEAVSG
jgi:hypothetical protein